MISDIEYIDKLISKNLKDHEQVPETNWSQFQSKFSGKLKSNFDSNKRASVVTKNILLAIISASIITTGIVINSKTNTSKQKQTVCKKAKTKQYKGSNNVIYKIKSNKNIRKDSNSLSNDKNIKTNNSENVIIRIEVPVYKKVKVRKKILINDSI